jgi:hypothetical protein
MKVAANLHFEVAMRIQLARTIVVGFALAITSCRSASRETAAYDSCDSVMRPLHHCSADGNVSVQVIDDRRVLVAIDVQDGGKPDGFVDQLFLYTASEPNGFQTKAEAFSGHVEYSGDALRVIGKDGRQALLFVVPSAAGDEVSRSHKGTERRFDRSIGLSRYTGWHGLRVARLSALHASASCDGPPGACVEVDGIHIQFPA